MEDVIPDIVVTDEAVPGDAGGRDDEHSQSESTAGDAQGKKKKGFRDLFSKASMQDQLLDK